MEHDKNSKLLATAQSEEGFAFKFFIEKAVQQVEPDDSYCIVGVASTPNIDHDMERMALPALKRMAEKINYDGVPLRVEHQKNENAIIGKVSEAWVDPSNKLWIKASLDRENVAAKMLHEALKSGAKLGLSVGGRVKQAIREMSEHQGKMIKTFFDVQLDEVSVTPRPSNYDSWLLNKHIVQEGDNVEALYNTPIHDSFLRDNPKFDYLVAIEKSIPDKAWKKVELESNLKNTMEKEYVTKQQFEDFSNGVLEVLRKFTQEDADGKTREMDAPAAMEEAAHDQNLPVDEKETPESQKRTVKEQAEKSGANGSDEHGQREKNPGEGKIADGKQEAHDADQPDTDKKENPAQVRTVKSEVKSAVEKLAEKLRKTTEMTESSETKEKAFPPKEDMTETKEKAFPEDMKSSTKEKEMTESETKEKEMSETKEKEAPETESTHFADKAASSEETKHDNSDYELPEVKRSVSSLDAFSVSVAELIDGAEARLNKSGRRIPGLRNLILDFVRQDAEIQKDIKAMMKQPGVKKSVIGNTPMAFLKDGTQLRLVPAETFVQKSEAVNKNAKFGDVYKSNFSSSQDAHIQGIR